MEYKSITSVIEEELDSLLVQGLEWDICYSFFFKHRLDLRKYKETACKVLLRYLSAFGMTSRTAFFVRWNYHDLKPLIEYCINHPEYYDLDLNKYEELIVLYIILSSVLISYKFIFRYLPSFNLDSIWFS